MLKILSARLQQYMNWELPHMQAGFQRRGGTRDQIANIRWIMEKVKGFKKNIYFCYSDYAKDCMWITTNCRKFLKRCKYQITLSFSWESCMWIKKQQLELDIEQMTGSKLGREYNKAVYCHPAYLTSMKSTSCEIPGWMNHKLVRLYCSSHMLSNRQ